MSEVEADATKALADVKGVIAALPAEEAKVKTLWTDYRLYIVCTLCLIMGGIAGAKIAAILHHL